MKTSYAGTEWKPEAFTKKVDLAKEQLAAISHAPKVIKPGNYKVYLAPAALYELIGILSWGRFGLRAHKTKQTPLS